MNVYEWAEPGSYHIVYCRFLLQHLSRPVDVLRTMWQALRVGGAIVVEDADFEGSFCDPPNPGFAFWIDAYPRMLARRTAKTRNSAAHCTGCSPRPGSLRQQSLSRDGPTAPTRTRLSPTPRCGRPQRRSCRRVSRPPRRWRQRWRVSRASPLTPLRCTGRRECSRPGRGAPAIQRPAPGEKVRKRVPLSRIGRGAAAIRPCRRN